MRSSLLGDRGYIDKNTLAHLPKHRSASIQNVASESRSGMRVLNSIAVKKTKAGSGGKTG